MGFVSLPQCVDCYGNIFLGIVRIRMVVLGEGDYVSTAISILPSPTSKYVLGGSSSANLGFPINETPLHPATTPFHEHRACKGVDEMCPRFFSYLNEEELSLSLEPCFRAWLSCSSLPPPSDSCHSGIPDSFSKNNQGTSNVNKRARISPKIVEDGVDITEALSPLPVLAFDFNNSFGLELPDGTGMDGVLEQEIIKDFLKIEENIYGNGR